jgi:hypothetical protein
VTTEPGGPASPDVPATETRTSDIHTSDIDTSDIRTGDIGATDVLAADVLTTDVFSSAAFSAVARTGIDLASLGTWDPALARPPRLLVPVDVQALVVGPGDAITHVPVLPPLADPQALDGTTPAPDITLAMPPVPPFSPATSRPAGIYLHWAAPDGLTTTASPLTPTEATPGSHVGAGLPPLADRWLVTRVGGGTPRRTRSWIIESERARLTDLATWAPSDTPPVADPGATPHLPAGQLTAAAGGDPGWAALFDAVQNRFALYDDLSDLDPAYTAGPLSYLVCGWWSDDTNDPLYVPDLASVVDRTATLRWSFPPVAMATAADRDLSVTRASDLGYLQPRVGVGTTVDSTGAMTLTPAAGIHPDMIAAAGTVLSGTAADHPHLTLLHGSVYGVTPAGGGIDSIPDPTDVEVAVGTTATEAFAAIIAAADPTLAAGTDQLIAAFSQGLISRLDTPDGLVDVDQAAHASGFVAQAGSTARTDRLVAGNRLAQGAAAVAGNLSALQQSTTTAQQTAAGASALSIGRERAVDLLVERDRLATVGALLIKQAGATSSPDPTALQVREVAVASETWQTPTDPVVTLRGAVRSLRHGYDGRFTADQTLACRVSGTECVAFTGLVAGSDLVDPLGNGALPPECDQLLQELVLDDPYRLADTAAAATAASGLPATAVSDRLLAEHALRWDATSSVTGKDLLRSVSLRVGTEASPVATTAWVQPWIPLYLEWQLSLRVDDTLARWTLADIDVDPAADPDPGAAIATRVYSGRSLLTSVAARTFAAQVSAFLAEEAARGPGGAVLQPDQDGTIGTIATVAGSLDLLSGALSDLGPQLLGLAWADSGRSHTDADGNPILPAPIADPLLIRGGTAWFSALRVVDAFGRTVDLPTAGVVAGPQLQLPPAATPAPVPPPTPVSSDPPAPSATPVPQLLLRPRITRPARLSLDFVDASAPDGAGAGLAMVDQQDPTLTVSPLAGWLLPDHFDGALEVHDAAANPLGALLEDLNERVVWEGAPGRPGPIGAPPAAVRPGDTAARHVVRLAAGLVAADTQTPVGQESALAALLRTVDTTAWTSDPLGWVGTEHPSVLVGRPIAVLRMTVRIDVADDLGTGPGATLALDPAARAVRQAVYDLLSSKALTVRLGELTRTDDTTLGYFVNDDYSTFTPVSPEVLQQARVAGRLQGQLATLGPESAAAPAAQPIVHPYVDDSETPLQCRPGQTIVLTVLMAPGGWVHATTGLLPRVATSLARDWIAEPLKLLLPTFRVGPLLVDPATIAVPKSTGLPKQQVFTARDTPSTWQDHPLSPATQDALLPDQPASTVEGWLRVVLPDPSTSTSGPGS